MDEPACHLRIAGREIEEAKSGHRPHLAPRCGPVDVVVQQKAETERERAEQQRDGEG
jgi:hypothetical protein